MDGRAELKNAAGITLAADTLAESHLDLLELRLEPMLGFVW